MLTCRRLISRGERMPVVYTETATMTRQKSFKKRVRARMLKTGERYAAARRVLLEQARRRRRRWVSEPEMSDEAVQRATGRGWDDWCELVDAWPGREKGHTVIARYLREEHDVDPWWAQAVTGGYERIVGLRLPGQMPDGSFTANKSKTLPLEAEPLDAALRDPAAYDDLFPGLQVDLRSRPDSKAVRLGFGEGIAVLSVAAKAAGKCQVAVQHQKLPDSESLERWRFFWQDWLDALADEA